MFYNHPLLLFVDLLLLVIMTFFIYIAWRFNKNFKGVKEWFFAFAFAATNLFLFIVNPYLGMPISDPYLYALLVFTGLFAFIGCRQYIGIKKDHRYYYFIVVAFVVAISLYYSESIQPLGFALASFLAGGFCIGAGITLQKGGIASHPIRYALSIAIMAHGAFLAGRPLLFLPSIAEFLLIIPHVNGFIITLFEQIVISPVLALFVILLINEDNSKLLRIQAEYDFLTCLRNRGSYFTQLRKAANLSMRLKTPLSILAIDIDHFKSINDNYGHTAGDEILKLFARSAEQCIRDGDSVGRIGGEEFSIFLMNTSTEQAQKIAGRLQSLIAESECTVDNQKVRYTISIGIAYFDGTQSVESIISSADKALYAAKRKGRNLIEIASVA